MKSGLAGPSTRRTTATCIGIFITLVTILCYLLACIMHRDPISISAESPSQPKETPIIPKKVEEVKETKPAPDFSQQIKKYIIPSANKVADYEIHPGTSVLHNFSAVPSSKTMKAAGWDYFVITYDSGWMKEHFVYLPAFDWKEPKGLTKITKELFYKQPENHMHFKDTGNMHVGVVWETPNGQSTLTTHGHCVSTAGTHHKNFCKFPDVVSKPDIKGNLIVNGRHEINYFQHFCDNGIPHISISSFATGYMPKELSIATNGCNSNNIKMLERAGYKMGSSMTCQSDSKLVSADNLIQVVAVPVVHAAYFPWFQEQMHLPKVEKDLVILLPRGGGSGGKAERIISNLNKLVDPLKKKFGDDKVVWFTSNDPKSQNFDYLIDIFGRAKAIIGPHGGAFYNQFLSQPGTVVVELLPVRSDGKYPRQVHFNHFTFAHLAMYSNTQLLNQEFWRYYTIDADMIYDIDVPDFLKWFDQIPL